MTALNATKFASPALLASVGGQRQQGVGLLEYAIVLFVISLLLGGALRANELVHNTQGKELAEDFLNAQHMFNAYQDKYRAAPGDDSRVAQHLGTPAQPGNGDGVVDGHWYDPPSGDSEAGRVWSHFTLAGLTVTNTVGSAPTNALGHPMGLQQGTSDPTSAPIVGTHGEAIPGNIVVCSRGIPGDLALLLDIRFDDGNPGTGTMMAVLESGYALGAMAATLPTGTASDVRPEQQYIVCLGF